MEKLLKQTRELGEAGEAMVSALEQVKLLAEANRSLTGHLTRRLDDLERDLSQVQLQLSTPTADRQIAPFEDHDGLTAGKRFSLAEGRLDHLESLALQSCTLDRADELEARITGLESASRPKLPK